MQTKVNSVAIRATNKSFYLVGDYSHEGLSIDVDLSIPARWVVHS
jgi:hypothetical protein